MNTPQEIEKLALELVAAHVANEAIRTVELPAVDDERCPCCNKRKPRRTRAENISKCTKCFTYFGEGYLFQFPLWARTKKGYFRRAFCLYFNIQFKGSNEQFLSSRA